MTTALDVFDRFREYVLGTVTHELWAPDVVIEQPFAAGGPSRIVGRETFLEKTRGSREALPVRDGLMTLWREYQNTALMAEKLGNL